MGVKFRKTKKKEKKRKPVMRWSPYALIQTHIKYINPC